MGRKKIELKLIECPKEKSSKFSKRKKGFLKKAEELAILCDTDIVLLVFSPTSKPNLFYPHSRHLSRILEKLSNMSEDEREERLIFRVFTLVAHLKKETIEIPNEKRNYYSGRYNHDFFYYYDKIIELREARELLDEKISILRKWQDPDRVDDLARLTIMEDHLVFNLSLFKNVLGVNIK
ncbi:unnamed protein product [Eruca vesicaria subsp. sativa]|uniref:MADS-box domain-containing protein n=1 Tax=Eruca vesicaria subsp. sativa TaxID=29727 RepID=A0ABC8JT96_ERUVS|nr:unnamed protein product [Eruca vesicaria subsp. sativa]